MAEPTTSKRSRGERNIAWIEAFLKAPSGKRQGKPLILQDWQKQILLDIYDNPAKGGTKNVIISMPRKQGKSFITSCMALLALFGPESMPNTDMYCAALMKDQARLLFNQIVKMIRQNPKLESRCRIREHVGEIVTNRRIKFKILAKDSKGTRLQGLESRMWIYDEIGEVEATTCPVYDALKYSTLSYDDAMGVCISTQASRDEYVFSRIIDDARLANDPNTILKLYECPVDVDPYSELALELSNPAYGNLISKDILRSDQARVQRNPENLPNFRNKILNMRVKVDAGFIDVKHWAACAGEVEDWRGKPVIVGLDLSETNDLTAMSIISPNSKGGYDIHPFFWLPEAEIIAKEREDGQKYSVWRDQGHIELIPGPVVDYDFVAQKLWEVHENADIQKLSVLIKTRFRPISGHP